MKVINDEKEIRNIKRIKRLLNYIFVDVIPEEEMKKMIKEIEKKEENKKMPTLNEKMKAYFESEKKRGRAEGRAEGREEGRVEGSAKKAIEITKRMINENISIELIMKVTDLTKDEVEKIANM